MSEIMICLLKLSNFGKFTFDKEVESFYLRVHGAGVYVTVNKPDERSLPVLPQSVTQLMYNGPIV